MLIEYIILNECIYELLLIYYVNLSNLKVFFSQNQCFKPVFAYIQLKLKYLDILFNQRYLVFEALMSSPNQVLQFPINVRAVLTGICLIFTIVLYF